MAMLMEPGSRTVHNTTPISPEIYQPMSMNNEEYAEVVRVLGRHPTFTEVGMYAVMWSEHCGYKYSRPVLRLFKKYREAIDGAGLENAGIIDIGDGIGVVMKMESHNHPSAVEPFQGAATGIGGILRDIFTMGARPIACLDSLRFGGLENPRNRYLFEHVISGIAFYGNCVGVPTVAGEVYFDDCYSGNCLVNVMAVGVMKHEDLALARAEGPGNPVLLVGSRTGRDGIHGATFASVELTEESESRKSNVQVGDPFTEKCLIEATLEALKTGYVVGIQDMGAAGITCSTCETAAKAGTGMKIDVRKVPLRETGMTPYEIMLSESQERMLAIAEKGHEDEVAGVFKKWGLNAVVIGEVTDDGLVHVYDGDELVAQCPAKSLADDAPTYYLDTEEPAYLAELQSYDLSKLPEPENYNDVLIKLLSSPSIANKRWIYEQYDHMVQTNTAVLPGSDAAVLRIRDTKKAIAVTTDCNGRYCYLDPFVGARIAVAEAARNLVCSGARPMGVTDCLNFANPEKPEAFWQFKRAVEGMAEACEFFNTPVISGNVSFYNETPETAVYPTPVVGMLGLIEDCDKRIEQGFKAEGDVVVLLSGKAKCACPCSLGGSEYMKVIHDTVAGEPPDLDLAAEKRLHKCVLQAIEEGLIKSAHDCSEGGLAVAIAECCISDGIGAGIEITDNGPASAALFGEEQSRIIITTSADDVERLKVLSSEHNVQLTILGEVGGSRLRLRFDDAILIDSELDRLTQAWREAIPGYMV